MARIRRIWWVAATAAVLLALAFGASAVVLAYAGSQAIHMSDNCWTNRYCT
jgi:hypothetical protein